MLPGYRVFATVKETFKEDTKRWEVFKPKDFERSYKLAVCTHFFLDDGTIRVGFEVVNERDIPDRSGT